VPEPLSQLFIGGESGEFTFLGDIKYFKLKIAKALGVPSMFADEQGDVAVLEPEEPEAAPDDAGIADESVVIEEDDKKAPDGTTKWPAFIVDIDNLYRANRAHVFALHGNVNDYPDNTGIRGDLGMTLFTRYDKFWLTEKVSQEVQNTGKKVNVKAPRATNVAARFTVPDGLVFATTGSFQAFADIVRKDPRYAEAKDEQLQPKDLPGTLILLNDYFKLSAMRFSQNQPLRTKLADKSLKTGARAAVTKELAERPEINLTVMFYDAKMCFPAGQVSTLTMDRTPIAYVENWALNGAIAPRNKIILIAQRLQDLQESLRSGDSRVAAIRVKRPTLEERKEWLEGFSSYIKIKPALINGAARTSLTLAEDLTWDILANNTAGMSRVQIEGVFMESWLEDVPVDLPMIADHKKKSLAAEYGDILDIRQPIPTTLCPETKGKPEEQQRAAVWNLLGGHDLLKQYAEQWVMEPMLLGDRRRTTRGFLLVGPAGCQPAGSRVLMADGYWKNVEDVKVGDVVVSPQHDGSSLTAIVTETVIYEDRPIFEVATKGRSVKKYRCADNHIVPYYRLTRPRVHSVRQPRHYVLEERQAKEILVMGKTASRVTFTTPAVEFPLEMLPVPPYVVGATLGHGSTSRSFDPAFVNADAVVWERMEANGYEFGKPMKDGITRYFIGKSAQSLRDLGLCGHKAETKRVPEQYKRGTIAQRLEVLAGLIDTEGSKDSFTSKSEGLAQDFIDLVHSVGGFANKKGRWTTCEGKKLWSYRAHYAFAEYTPVLSMVHKEQGVRDMGWKNPRRRDFTIQAVGRGTVYGFVLDSPSEWYVTDDWMVTHNTGKTWYGELLAAVCRINFVYVDFSKLYGGIVGETERNTERLYEAIEAMAPCIVFADEIDSAFSSGRQSAGDSGVQARVFNRTMRWLSDDARWGKVVVLAATNRPDLLDEAFIRAGRFDDVIPALPPHPSDAKGRKSLLAAVCKKTGVRVLKSLVETLKTPDNGLGRLIFSPRVWTGAEVERLVKMAFGNAAQRVSRAAKEQAAAKKLPRRETLEFLRTETKNPLIELDDWNHAMDSYRPNTRQAETQIDLALGYSNNDDYCPAEWRSRLDAAREKTANTVESAANYNGAAGAYERD